jgi:DNA-binding NarL/FixJ family response regulator
MVEECAGSENVASQSLLIVSEVRFLREGIAAAIKGNYDLLIAGLCENLEQALVTIRGLPAATVLLDAAFPNGLEVLQEIRAIDATARVVVFAVSETEENIVAWAKAGAVGYIPTTAALNDLVQFLQCIIRGEQICSAKIASSLMRRIGSSLSSSHTQSNLHVDSLLTRREREIMRMIIEGLSNKEISRQLGIELSTTKSHVHNLLGKLRLQRRGQVAQRARNQENRIS